MVKVKVILLAYCFCLLFCCQRNSEEIKHKAIIDGISSENPEDYFSLYSNIMIFCKTQDINKLGYITVDGMVSIFNHDSLFQKMDYHKFIEGVINQKITLEDKYIEYSFVPDSAIVSEYKNYSFSEFFEANTDSLDVNRFLVESGQSIEKTMTVIYCLYQQKYYTGFDDYYGLYFSRKIDQPLKKTAEKVEIEIK